MGLTTVAKLFDNISKHKKLVSFSEQFDLVDSLLHLSFSENGLKLKQVLEEHYLDGIDGFEDVQVDGETITGIFIDRVSSALTKRFKFEVTPKNAIYYSLNPNDTEDFSELEFVATKQANKRNCVKGLSCGASCVPMRTDSGEPTKCRMSNSKAAEDLMNDLLVAVKASNKRFAGGRINDPTKELEQLDAGTGNVFDDIALYTKGVKKKKDKNVSINEDVDKILKTSDWKNEYESYSEKYVNDLNMRLRVDGGADIHDSIIRNANRKKRDPKHRFNFLSVDIGNTTQSLAAYHDKYDNNSIYVEYLVTAPWNLIKDDARNVRGSGTEAVLALVNKSKELGYKGRIVLEPTEDAQGFYEKLGFLKTNPKDRLDSTWELTPENADKLLRKVGK